MLNSVGGTVSSDQPVIVSAVLLAAIAHAACDRPGSANGSQLPGTVTLVNRVSASVRAENCPTCASALEAALRQRLSAVDISVSLERQTVDLEFPPSSPFASVSFREAVKEGGAEVQCVEIEACGTIDTADGQSWIKSGSARLLLDGPGPCVTGTEVCVTGELQDQERPQRLVPGKRINPSS
jgi:hypothetical protein